MSPKQTEPASEVVTKAKIKKKKRNKKVKYPYLEDERLSDVIRLITLLAKTERFTFREVKGIEMDLNGPPKSSTNWFDMASEHPEFFRFTTDGEKLVLLLRFVSRVQLNKEEHYPALNIDQTQKLVDQAIALHDKQLLRYQRNNFKMPLWTAIIAAIVTLVASTLNWTTSRAINQRLDKLTNKMDSISLKQAQMPLLPVIRYDSVNVKTGNRRISH